jgi:hypothetical protein
VLALQFSRAISRVIAIYSLVYNVPSLQHVGRFHRNLLLFARYSSLGWRSEPRLAFYDSPALWSHRGAQMAANSRRRRLGGKARRALELLVDQQGNAKAYLGAYLGFTDRMLFLLAQAGLITIRHEIINTGAELIDIGRVRITDAGRRALEDTTERRPSPRLQPDE